MVKKRLLRVALGLLLLLVLVLGIGILFIDSIARKGIESASTYALGVNTSLDSASIGLTSGEFGLKQLQVANPQGFSPENHFLTLGSAHMAVSLGTLMEDTVRVPVLELADIKVVLEPKDRRHLTSGEEASYNYEVILDNLKRLSDANKEEAAKDKPEEEPSKHFHIESIVLKNISVDAYYQIGRQEIHKVSGTIPEVKMSFSTKEGATIEELTSVVLQTILGVIAENLGDVLPNLIVDGLFEGVAAVGGLAAFGVDVVDGAGKAIFDAAKGVGSLFGGASETAADGAGKVAEGVSEGAAKAVESLGNLGEGIGKGVEDVGKNVGEGINKIGEGLGGLFGGGKGKKDDK